MAKKHQNRHNSGFQETDVYERSGSRNEQVQSWDSKPETSEPLCGKVERGSTQLKTLRIACRATLRDQLKSRSEKRGELAMPAFRVEGDATAPLRGFAF